MGKGHAGKDRNVIGTISFEVEIDGKPMPAFDEYLAPKIQKLVETEVSRILSEALDALDAKKDAQAKGSKAVAKPALRKRVVEKRSSIKRPASKRPVTKRTR